MSKRNFNNPRTRAIAALLSGVATMSAVSAQTVYVNASCGNDAWTGASVVCAAPDGPKQTIQAAIDAANPGDTVSLADGTYRGAGNKNLDFQAKAITLRSQTGNRDQCIIDCEDDGQFATFGAGDTALVESITIQNGNAINGGAALLSAASSPSFIDCVIKDCHANTRGGALAVLSSSLTINGCAFQDNTAGTLGGAIWTSSAPVLLVDTEFDTNQAFNGGGVYINRGQATVSGCSFTANYATGAGGGLRVVGGAMLRCTDSSFTANLAEIGGAGLLANLVDPTSFISGCTFTNNQAGLSGDGGGGGFAYTSNFGAISECVFDGNIAWFAGGALFRGAGAPRVEDVVFLNNTAIFGGGACVEPGNTPEFVNCLFAGNSATSGLGFSASGGAIEIYGSGATRTMVNCTFSDNSSEEFGGAINVLGDAELRLDNCVLWGNAAPAGPEIRISYPGFKGGTVTVSYSDVEGGEAGVSVGPGGTLIWGAGNIDEDPLFVDRPNGDYRLAPASPCIDTGDPSFPAPGGKDLDGLMRVWNARVDMGCYEFGSFVFGDLNCDGAFNGGDIDPFFLALGDPAAYAAQFPNCDPLLGDMNADGLFNGGDIDPFFACLGGGVCP